MKMKKRIVLHAVSAALLGLLLLYGCGSGGGPKLYAQIDRLARPVVNEVFATVANNRHAVNNQDNPTDDPGQLANDIRGFMTFPAGRSAAIRDVVVAVLVPDVMKANL